MSSNQGELNWRWNGPNFDWVQYGEK